jgi:hypothetical protein
MRPKKFCDFFLVEPVMGRQREELNEVSCLPEPPRRWGYFPGTDGHAKPSEEPDT